MRDHPGGGAERRHSGEDSRVLVGDNLFDVLSEDDRARLLSVGRERVVEADEEVVRQGSIGDRLFVVIEGELAVVRCLPGDEEKVLAHRTPGTILGEVAVLDGGARSASLRATRRSVLREIGLRAFEAVTLYGGDSGYRILRAVAASVHDRLMATRQAAAAAATASRTTPGTSSLEWSAADPNAARVLAALPALAGLDAAAWKAMIPRIASLRLDRGGDLVLPDASHPGIVLVLRGALSPWLDDAGGPEVAMPAVGPGGFVDYAAALGFAAEPRLWRARSPTVLLKLDAALFEPGAAFAAPLLYALSRHLATTLRRGTALAMHFRMAWVRPGLARAERPAALRSGLRETSRSGA